MGMPDRLPSLGGLSEPLGVPDIRERAERPPVVINNWTSVDVPALTRLEQNWAEWLRKPPSRIRTIANDERKARTHFIAKIPQTVGSMSVTRTNWEGDPRKLGPWDFYAGGSVEESDYPIYQATGDTFVIMSVSVDSAHQRQGIARALVTEVQKTAHELGIKHIIGPFRPSAYGDYKLKVLAGENPRISFEDYCKKVIANEEEDPWLKAALNMGMKPLLDGEHLRVEEHS